MESNSKLFTVAVAGLVAAGLSMGTAAKAFADHNPDHAQDAKSKDGCNGKDGCESKDGCEGKEKAKDSCHGKKAHAGKAKAKAKGEEQKAK